MADYRSIYRASSLPPLAYRTNPSVANVPTRPNVGRFRSLRDLGAIGLGQVACLFGIDLTRKRVRTIPNISNNTYDTFARLRPLALGVIAFLVLTGCAQSDDPCASRRSQIGQMNCAAHVPEDGFRDSLSVERTSSQVVDLETGAVIGGSAR